MPPHHGAGPGGPVEVIISLKIDLLPALLWTSIVHPYCRPGASLGLSWPNFTAPWYPKPIVSLARRVSFCLRHVVKSYTFVTGLTGVGFLCAFTTLGRGPYFFESDSCMTDPFQPAEVESGVLYRQQNLIRLKAFREALCVHFNPLSVSYKHQVSVVRAVATPSNNSFPIKILPTRHLSVLLVLV